MDSYDLELFERSLASATARAAGVELDAALEEIGWPEALGAEPWAAITTLFRLQGAAGVTSSALGAVVAAGLGAEQGWERATVLPEVGSDSPPGHREPGGLSVRGVLVAPAERALCLVACTGTVATVEVDALTRRTVSGMDPSLGLVEVTGTSVPVRSESPADWGRAVAMAQVALGFELVGNGRAMLRLARDHATERVQFDRPIGSFQAVRHRLAETLVALDGAEGVLDAAAEDGADAAALAGPAKALAGRAARTAARHCQQVLAGMGFTAAHAFPAHLRRVMVLEQLFGSSRLLTRRLGAGMLETGTMPASLPL